MRRFFARFSEADIELIDRAAGLCGHSRTRFIRDAAVRAAEEMLLESRLIPMTQHDFADFLAILAERANPVAEIVEMMRRTAPWEDGYTRKQRP